MSDRSSVFTSILLRSFTILNRLARYTTHTTESHIKNQNTRHNILVDHFEYILVHSIMIQPKKGSRYWQIL